ncbi:MAG: LLM class flavin-dependent oxidoreductase [Halobacteria archaeon]
MKLALGITTSMPLEKSISYAKIAEENNYHRVWIGEDILSREVFTYISIIALKTERIQLATGITSPYLRNIAVIASNAAGIQILSKNRFTLGLGVGGIPEIEKIMGKKPDRVIKIMRETALLLRKIFKGEKITYEGRTTRLRDYKLSIKLEVEPKIYFGVRGEKLLALAGEIADGVIFSGPKRYLKRAMQIVDEAAERAGRDKKEIDRVLWNCTVEVENEEDLKLARLVSATIAASLPKNSLSEADQIREKFKAGRYEEAAQMMSEEFMREFCIYGSKKEILNCFNQFKEMGFREFVVGPPFSKNPARTIKSIGRASVGIWD